MACGTATGAGVGVIAGAIACAGVVHGRRRRHGGGIRGGRRIRSRGWIRRCRRIWGGSVALFLFRTVVHQHLATRLWAEVAWCQAAYPESPPSLL